MKNKKKKKIYKDKNGRDFIRESYFVGGKMKFRRIYVIDGIPADEFYKNNATDMDFYLNGDYALINSEINNNHIIEQNKNEPDVNDLSFKTRNEKLKQEHFIKTVK